MYGTKVIILKEGNNLKDSMYWDKLDKNEIGMWKKTAHEYSIFEEKKKIKSLNINELQESNLANVVFMRRALDWTKQFGDLSVGKLVLWTQFSYLYSRSISLDNL